jgi:hypothetical protein
VNDLALSLSERGHLVTQIHHTGHVDCPEWSHNSQGAALHWYAEQDCVITSDGKTHAV